MISKLEKAITFSLFLYAIFAPHSIFLSELFVVLGLVFWALKIAAVKKLEGKWIWKSGKLERPIFAFCIIGILSLLTAYDRFQALTHIKSLWLFLFYFLIVNNLNNRDLIIRLILILVISTTFASLYGLFQYFFRHTIGVRAFIKNVMTLAGFFLLVTPLSFSFFLGERIFSRKTFYLFATLCLVLGLIFTLERNVWVGLGVAILTFASMNKRSLVTVSLGVIILLLLFTFSPPLRQRAKTFGKLRSYSISSRFHQWQAGLEMMFDHPLTGVGPGNYEIIYKQYKFFEERKIYSHAHSNIVQIGAETGILGLSIFFWLMVAAFRSIYSRIKQMEGLYFSLSVGVLAAFLGFNLAGFFEYNFGDSELQLLFWLILGALENI